MCITLTLAASSILTVKQELYSNVFVMEMKQTWTFIDSVVTLVVFVVAVVGRLVVDDVVVVLRADQVVGDRGSGNGKLKCERSAMPPNF